MKVLVVGGGGREHAICQKLSQSKKIDELYCAPGNAGIALIAECVPLKAADIDGIVDFSVRSEIDFVVVAPDDPLALGLVDRLQAKGITAFGPGRQAARLESSKVFSKTLMKKYNIPTARWECFDNAEKAIDYIHSVGAPIVVKADGLALGKGVVVAQTVPEAETAVREMMVEGRFSEAGKRVVIEEFMTGPEVTVLAFCDGKTVKPMPPSQDHKRIGEGDTGPNTGGMGVISPVSSYTREISVRCMNEIFIPTIQAMRSEGCPFSGVIYFGLMLTPDGPKVVEYNVRFGDPEAQAVLLRLETDLFDIFQSVTDGTLDEIDICWSEQASAAVVLASGGYPGKYETGKKIHGLDNIESGVTIFHAGTVGGFQTAGGRVLTVSALGEDVPSALKRVYGAVEKISFDNMVYRRDIGWRELEK